MNPRTKLIRNAIIAILVLAVAGTGFWFAFRRTLIPTVTEALMAPDTTDPVAYGKVLFQTRGCGGCHTLDDAGSDGDNGPILNGIATRHDALYIASAIKDPSTISGAVCPEGPCAKGIMPKWGDILDQTQIDAVTAYLMQQK